MSDERDVDGSRPQDKVLRVEGQRLLGRPLHHIEARAMQVLHDESTESRLDDPRHVVELLETVASVRPTVLVLDNIRWARKATFAVLKVLAEHLDQH